MPVHPRAQGKFSRGAAFVLLEIRIKTLRKVNIHDIFYVSA
jgi:hypothetical protein